MLRVLVGLTFHRAKMKDVYSIIRGRDIETGEFSEVLRAEQFAKLKNSLPIVLDNTNWQSFLKVLIGGGTRTRNSFLQRMPSSTATYSI